MSAGEARLRELADRLELVELAGRYGEMADEKAFDDARAVLTEDVVAEYPFGRHDGIEQVAGSGREWLGRFERTQHVLTNVLVELDGDAARMRANLIATHVHRAAEPERHFVLGGFYRFAARRTPGGWRIAHVHLTAVWTAGESGDEH